MGVFLDDAKRDTVDLWKRLQQQAEETILSGLDRSATADIAQEERMAAKRRDASRGEIVSQINAGATKLQNSLSGARQTLQRFERKPPPDERAKYDWFTDEYYQEKLDEWNRNKQTIRDQIDDMQAGISFYNKQKGQLQATWDSLTSNMMTKIPSIVGPNIDPAAVAAARARGRQILAQDLEKYDPDMLSLVDPEMAAFIDVRKRIDQGGPETLQEIMDSPSYKNVLFGGESGDTAAMADYYESGAPVIDISNIDQFLRQYGLGGTAPAAEDAYRAMPDSERRAEEERMAREARGEGSVQQQLSDIQGEYPWGDYNQFLRIAGDLEDPQSPNYDPNWMSGVGRGGSGPGPSDQASLDRVNQILDGWGLDTVSSMAQLMEKAQAARTAVPGSPESGDAQLYIALANEYGGGAPAAAPIDLTNVGGIFTGAAGGTELPPVATDESGVRIPLAAPTEMPLLPDMSAIGDPRNKVQIPFEYIDPRTNAPLLDEFGNMTEFETEEVRNPNTGEYHRRIKTGADGAPILAKTQEQVAAEEAEKQKETDIIAENEAKLISVVNKFRRAANAMRGVDPDTGMATFPNISGLENHTSLPISEQVAQLRDLYETINQGRLQGTSNSAKELEMVNAVSNQLRADVALELEQVKARQAFELASSNLSLEIAKAMEEGRVFDQGLEFQYRQAQSDLDQANRALEMSAWQTAVENPFNVAAMNMLSGQNVFAPQATPTDAFQQALGPQQGNVQRYNDQGQLVTMTDPELEQMQQRMLANPDRPMFSGQGFDTPVTREQFVMAYNQLLQRGMSPTDAATALGMGPDGLRKMQELTTPGVRPRTGGGVPPSMGVSPFAGAFSSAPSGVGGFTAPPPALGAPQQGAPMQQGVDARSAAQYYEGGAPHLPGVPLPQGAVSQVGSLGAIPKPLQNIGFQIPEQARFGQGLGIKNFFAGGTPTVSDIANLPSVSRGLLQSIGEATGTTREELMQQASDITPTTVSAQGRLSPAVTRLREPKRGYGAY